MIKVRRAGMGVEGLVSFVLRGVHRAIYRYRFDPFQRRIPDLAAMKPGWWRSALLEGALWGANLGRLAITDLRAHVRRLKGADWSVSYIGARYSFEEVRHILFPRPAGVEESSRAFLWHVPALARRSARQGGLVVCELNQITRWRPRGKCVFTVPRWIRRCLISRDQWRIS
jgi:hypothetical protein